MLRDKSLLQHLHIYALTIAPFTKIAVAFRPDPRSEPAVQLFSEKLLVIRAISEIIDGDASSQVGQELSASQK